MGDDTKHAQRIIREARRAVERDPEKIDLRLSLAKALQDSGDISEALEQFVDALARDPTSLEALRGAAECAASLGDAARAEGYRRLLAAFGAQTGGAGTTPTGAGAERVEAGKDTDSQSTRSSLDWRGVRIGGLCHSALNCRRGSGRVNTAVFGASLAAALLIVNGVSPPVSGCSSAGGEPPAHTGYVLTTRSVLRTDLDPGRITRTRALPSPGRKIVRAGPHVAIQQAEAIQIFDADALTEQQSVRLSEGISDIAASGPLLYAASGRRVHVFCVLPGGGVEPLTTITLPITSPKRIDFVTAKGWLVYALDDVLVPLYAYLIDVTRPASPRISSAYWKGLNAIDTDFVAQAVADRWYVMVNSAEKGLYVAVLPVHPPLGQWVEHVMLIYNKVGPEGRINSASFAHEFQVYDGMLYGLEGLSRLTLYQTPANAKEAAITEVADLGRVSLERRRGVITVEGSRLYVAGDTTLYGFELSKGSQPIRVLRMNAGAPIVSFAAGGQTP